MASSTETAKRYFRALAAHDLEAAATCWKPGGLEHMGDFDLPAPDGIREYFQELFDAFPDFRFEVVDTTTYRERCAVRWRATGTFAGPGRFQNLTPNGARIEISGCDLLTVQDGLITSGDVYMDTGGVARQLGFLPPAGSKTERRMATLANVRTHAQRLLFSARPEAIAAGVWVLRGGLPRAMNVYLIEDEGGVTLFDAGVSDMRGAIASSGVAHGGVRRLVLSHADADHRGGAQNLGAPVFCHPLEREAAESPESYRPYWNLNLVAAYARPFVGRLMRRWDGGALQVEGTLEEGDDVAGFRVVHLPGHAPGQIGLFREEDGLALVSDCVLAVDPETGFGERPTVPHPAFNQDTEQARESIRKLADLRPKAVWLGHGRPVTGNDVERQLHQAAAAAV